MGAWVYSSVIKPAATGILFYLGCVCNAQVVLELRLIDSQNRPLSFALVKYENKVFACSHAGVSYVNNYQEGLKISVHKFGFADTLFSVRLPAEYTDTVRRSLVLRLKPSLLPEVSIVSGKAVEINPMKADFVLGFEIQNECLLEVLSDGHLLMLDSNGLLKSRTKTELGADDLLKDPRGDIYLVSDPKAYFVDCKKPGIWINKHSADLIRLNWFKKYCDDVDDTTLYIRKYKDNNQTLAFFAVSTQNEKHPLLLKEITDEARKNAVASFANETNSLNHYLAGLGINKMTASTSEELYLVNEAIKMSNMLELHYVLPSYSFLKRVNDRIYLFAHDLDSMFVFDRQLNFIGGKRITYHHLKTWGKELYVNEERTRVYSKMIDNSRVLLVEVDLSTGSLKQNSVVIESRFPKRLKIWKERVYYMAKQKSGAGYSVYSQPLVSSQ